MWKKTDKCRLSRTGGKDEMLELPYGNHDQFADNSNEHIKFYVMLNRDGNDIPIDEFKFLYSSLRRPVAKMEIVLPKFKIESKLGIKSILEKVGVPMKNSDLAHQPLEVSDAIHQAVIDLDEKGTEAAAATAIMMMRCAMIPRETEDPFIVDQPFKFLIYDSEHDVVLFSGKFQTPKFV